MATDGSRIVYNPAFVDELKPAELEGTLAHEVLHCALGHQCRRGERDPRLWNEAADLAINPILLENGFTLPAGALIDPAFNKLERRRNLRPIAAGRTEGGAAPKQAPQQTNAGGGTGSSPQATRGSGPCNAKSDLLSASRLQSRAGRRRVKPRDQKRPDPEGSGRSGMRPMNRANGFAGREAPSGARVGHRRGAGPPVG